MFDEVKDIKEIKFKLIMMMRITNLCKKTSPSNVEELKNDLKFHKDHPKELMIGSLLKRI